MKTTGSGAARAACIVFISLSLTGCARSAVPGGGDDGSEADACRAHCAEKRDRCYASATSEAEDCNRAYLRCVAACPTRATAPFPSEAGPVWTPRGEASFRWFRLCGGVGFSPKDSSTRWYVRGPGVEYGPLSTAQLRGLVRGGEVRERDPVRRRHGEYKPLRRFKRFRKDLEVAQASGPDSEAPAGRGSAP